jgi:hypothetical protein
MDGSSIEMKAKTFNPSAGHPARALQAWQILVGMAMNRQTVTYSGLSKLMYGKLASGVLASILGHIAFWCTDRGLPELNSIVVGKGRGTPGDRIPLDRDEIDAERENVYEVDWHNIWPPTEAELRDARAAHANSD